MIRGILVAIYNDLVQLANMFKQNHRTPNASNIGGGLNILLLILLVMKVVKLIIRYINSNKPDNNDNSFNRLSDSVGSDYNHHSVYGSSLGSDQSIVKNAKDNRANKDS